MKKETLVSIAERSGCSISTVSRVLSGNAAKYRISHTLGLKSTEVFATFKLHRGNTSPY